MYRCCDTSNDAESDNFHQPLFVNFHIARFNSLQAKQRPESRFNIAESNYSNCKYQSDNLNDIIERFVELIRLEDGNREFRIYDGQGNVRDVIKCPGTWLKGLQNGEMNQAGGDIVKVRTTFVISRAIYLKPEELV